MLYIANAFSLNMVADLADNADVALELGVMPITNEYAQRLIRRHAPNVDSAVGHADIASVIGTELDMNVEANRISLSLTEDDSVLVAQYSGPRLEEGATELPENATIRYYLVYPINTT